MAQVRRDEVLGKAVSTDSTVIPRYNLVDPNGNVVATNVQLVLQNPVVTEGTNVDKATLDECLAASGITGGTNTAYTLAQENFALFDGALVRIKLHTLSGATPTLNVNGTGAKKLMLDANKPFRGGVAAGTWVTFVYSSTYDFFLQQGSSSTVQSGTDAAHSTYQMLMCNQWGMRGW